MTKQGIERATLNCKNRSITLVTASFLRNPKGKIQGRHRLTFAGIALSVFALLAVSSIMNGFDKDMRQRIIGTRSEMRLDNKNGSPLADYETITSKLEKQKSIQAVAPVVRNELMLVNGSAMAATVCFGIDYERQLKISPILHPIVLNSNSAPSSQWFQGIAAGKIEPKEFEAEGIILGAELAQSINAMPGDIVQLVSPLGTIPTPLGLLPRTLNLKVSAIFVAGMPEYDRLYSYVPLSVGQLFSGYADEIDHLDIKTAQPEKLFKITKNLRKTFPDYRIENWSTYDSSLYGAMHFEKYLMLVILGLMFVIASFNMTGNIFRTIVQKRRSLGVLKTIGYSDKELIELMLRQGMLIAVSGILAGMVIALILLTLQSIFGLIRLPAGNMDSLILPVDLRLKDFLIIPALAVMAAWLSVYIPARRAGKINPIDLIRDIV